MLDGLFVLYENEKYAIQDLAQVYAKDGQQLVVRVHDPHMLKEVEKAIREGPQSFQPQRESDQVLLVPIPKYVHILSFMRYCEFSRSTSTCCIG